MKVHHIWGCQCMEFLHDSLIKKVLNRLKKIIFLISEKTTNLIPFGFVSVEFFITKEGRHLVSDTFPKKIDTWYTFFAVSGWRSQLEILCSTIGALTFSWRQKSVKVAFCNDESSVNRVEKGIDYFFAKDSVGFLKTVIGDRFDLEQIKN